MKKESMTGVIAYVNLVLSFVFALFPFFAIDMGNLSFAVKIILVLVLSLIVYNFAVIGAIVNLILWIVVVVQCITGTITGAFAIICYILFAIFVIYKAIFVIIPLFKKSDTDE